MNLGTQALQILKTVAPLLGTAIGGPFGAIAGTALASVLGTKPGDAKATETALLAATPDQLVALKKADQDFQVQMKTLGVQEEQLAYADVASARTLEAQTKSLTPTVLSYAILGASVSAALLVVAGYVKIPSDPQTALTYGTVIGYLFSESKAVLGYWFGSSQSSQAKDATISDIAKQP